MTPSASLRTRLLVGVLAAMTACWVGTAIVGYAAARHELDELLDAHLVQTAAMLGEQFGTDGDEEEIEHVRRWHRYSTEVVFQVWRHGRHLTLHSSSGPAARLSDVDEGFSTRLIDGQRWRVFSVWTHGHESLVQVAELVSARRAVAGEIVQHMLLPLLVALPLLAVVLTLAIGRGLKPLDVLTAAIARQAPDRLERVGEAGVPREVRPLIGQLNDLFARIEALIAGERRFTADAAHELRTPIAAIRAHAEVALGASDDAERCDATRQVIAGCERAGHLIDQLMTLARLDATTARVAVGGCCRLDDVVRQTLALLGPAAHAKRIGLVCEASAQPLVLGDPVLLGVLARNLLDNAIRYSPPATTVTARIAIEDGVPLLEVIDQGPGIPAAERAKATERFYRGLGSDQPGSGLGLSIVSRIAALCGATFELATGAGGRGLTARLSFPKLAGARAGADLNGSGSCR